MLTVIKPVRKHRRKKCCSITNKKCTSLPFIWVTDSTTDDRYALTAHVLGLSHCKMFTRLLWEETRWLSVMNHHFTPVSITIAMDYLNYLSLMVMLHKPNNPWG